MISAIKHLINYWERHSNNHKEEQKYAQVWKTTTSFSSGAVSSAFTEKGDLGLKDGLEKCFIFTAKSSF